MANAFTIQGSATLNTRPAERRLQRFIKKAEGAQLNLKINERAFTQPLGRITGEVSEFNKSLRASNARVLAFGASAGAIFAITSAFREMAKATVNVEKRLADINVILGRSNSSLQKFGSQLFNIASKTGRAFNEVADAATEFSRQGLGVEKTLQRTRDAMILMRLSGLDAKNAVESLTAAMNSFNNVTLTSTQIVNKMAKVDAAFAVSSRDLAEAIKRVGATAEDAGLSMDQLLAAVTSVQQTTARGGPVIGNSLKTIFTRIKRVEVIEQLKGLGVQVKNLNGTMRPAMSVLKDFAEKFKGLSEAQKAQTAELVGGVFQMNILKSLLKDLARGQSVYSSALKDSVSASNEAILRNEELNKTLAALSNESLQNLTKLAAGIGKLSFEPVAKKVLNSFNKIVSGQALGDLSNILGFDQKEAAETGEKIGKGLLKGLGRFLEGPALLLLLATIGKLGTQLASFAARSGKDLLVNNKALEQRQKTEQLISSILQSQPQLLQKIQNGSKGVLAAEQQVLNTLRQQAVLRSQVGGIAGAMAPKIGKAGLGVRKSGGEASFGFSGGHVPSFAQRSAEVLSAAQGGYSIRPQDVISRNLSGLGKVTMNKKEEVKYLPFILPPKGSKAGRDVTKKSKSQHGFNPYAAAQGFVPNFRKGQKQYVPSPAQTEFADLLKAGSVKPSNFAHLVAGADTRTLTGFQSKIEKSGLTAKQKTALVASLGSSKTTNQAALKAQREKEKKDKKMVGGVYTDFYLLSADNRLGKNGPFSDQSAVKGTPFGFKVAGMQTNYGGHSSFDGLLNKHLSGAFKGIFTDMFPSAITQMGAKPPTLKQLSEYTQLESGAGVFYDGFVKKAVQQATKASNVSKGGWDIMNVANKAVQELFNVPKGQRVQKGDLKTGPLSKTKNKFVKDHILPELRTQYVGGNFTSSIIPPSNNKSTKAAMKKHVALGHVPNFSRTGGGLEGSIMREGMSMPSGSRVKVGTDRRLKGEIGVYNSSEGSLENAINMHMARGASISDLQRMGAAKGLVPNFANPAYQLGLSTKPGGPGLAAGAKGPGRGSQAAMVRSALKPVEDSIRSLSQMGPELRRSFDFGDKVKAYNLASQELLSTYRTLSAEARVVGASARETTGRMHGFKQQLVETAKRAGEGIKPKNVEKLVASVQNLNNASVKTATANDAAKESAKRRADMERHLREEERKASEERLRILNVQKQALKDTVNLANSLGKSIHSTAGAKGGDRAMKNAAQGAAYKQIPFMSQQFLAGSQEGVKPAGKLSPFINVTSAVGAKTYSQVNMKSRSMKRAINERGGAVLGQQFAGKSDKAIKEMAAQGNIPITKVNDGLRRVNNFVSQWESQFKKGVTLNSNVLSQLERQLRSIGIGTGDQESILKFLEKREKLYQQQAQKETQILKEEEKQLAALQQQTKQIKAASRGKHMGAGLGAAISDAQRKGKKKTPRLLASGGFASKQVAAMPQFQTVAQVMGVAGKTGNTTQGSISKLRGMGAAVGAMTASNPMILGSEAIGQQSKAVAAKMSLTKKQVDKLNHHFSSVMTHVAHGGKLTKEINIGFQKELNALGISTAEQQKIMGLLQQQAGTLQVTAQKRLDELSVTNQGVTAQKAGLEATRRKNQIAALITGIEKRKSAASNGILRGLYESMRLQGIINKSKNQQVKAAALAAKQEAKSAINSKFMSAGMGVSFIAPMLSSALAQNESDPRKRASKEGIGDVAMYAGMGMMFGGVGVAVGAAIGGMTALGKISKAVAEGELNELKVEAEKAKESFQDFQDGAQKLVMALQKYSSGISSPDIDKGELATRRSALAEALKDIPAQFRGQLAGSLADPDKLSNDINEIRKNTAKLVALDGLMLKIQEQESKNKGVIKSMTGGMSIADYFRAYSGEENIGVGLAKEAAEIAIVGVLGSAFTGGAAGVATIANAGRKLSKVNELRKLGKIDKARAGIAKGHAYGQRAGGASMMGKSLVKWGVGTSAGIGGANALFGTNLMGSRAAEEAQTAQKYIGAIISGNDDLIAEMQKTAQGAIFKDNVIGKALLGQFVDVFSDSMELAEQAANIPVKSLSELTKDLKAIDTSTDPAKAVEPFIERLTQTFKDIQPEVLDRLRKALESRAGGEGFSDITKVLDKFVKEVAGMADFRKLTDSFQAIIDSNARFAERMRASAQKAADAMDTLTIRLGGAMDRAIAMTLNRDKMISAGKSNIRDTFGAVATGGLNLNEPFLGSRRKAQADFSLSTANRRSDFVKELDKVREKGRSELLKATTAEFQRVQQKMSGNFIKSQQEGKDRRDQEIETKQLRTNQKIVENLSQQVISLLNRDSEAGSEQIQGLIIEEIRRKDFILSPLLEDLLETAKTQETENKNQLAALIQSNKNQEKIAEIQNSFAQKRLALDERLASFGGAGALGSFERIEGPIANLANQFREAQVAGRRESAGLGTQGLSNIMQGKAAFNTLSMIRNMMPQLDMNQTIMGNNTGASAGLTSLVGQAVEGRSTQISRSLGGVNNLLSSLGVEGGIGLDKSDIDQISREQIASEFKIENLAANMDAVKNGIDQLNAISNFHFEQFEDSNKTAFKQAMEEVKLVEAIGGTTTEVGKHASFEGLKLDKIAQILLGQQELQGLRLKEKKAEEDFRKAKSALDGNRIEKDSAAAEISGIQTDKKFMAYQAAKKGFEASRVGKFTFDKKNKNFKTQFLDSGKSTDVAFGESANEVFGSEAFKKYLKSPDGMTVMNAALKESRTGMMYPNPNRQTGQSSKPSWNKNGAFTFDKDMRDMLLNDTGTKEQRLVAQREFLKAITHRNQRTLGQVAAFATTPGSEKSVSQESALVGGLLNALGSKSAFSYTVPGNEKDGDTVKSAKDIYQDRMLQWSTSHNGRLGGATNELKHNLDDAKGLSGSVLRMAAANLAAMSDLSYKSPARLDMKELSTNIQYDHSLPSSGAMELRTGITQTDTFDAQGKKLENYKGGDIASLGYYDPKDKEEVDKALNAVPDEGRQLAEELKTWQTRAAAAAKLTAGFQNEFKAAQAELNKQISESADAYKRIRSEYLNPDAFKKVRQEQGLSDFNPAATIKQLRVGMQNARMNQIRGIAARNVLGTGGVGLDRQMDMSQGKGKNLQKEYSGMFGLLLGKDGEKTIKNITGGDFRIPYNDKENLNKLEEFFQRRYESLEKMKTPNGIQAQINMAGIGTEDTKARWKAFQASNPSAAKFKNVQEMFNASKSPAPGAAGAVSAVHQRNNASVFAQNQISRRREEGMQGAKVHLSAMGSLKTGTRDSSSVNRAGRLAQGIQAAGVAQQLRGYSLRGKDVNEFITEKISQRRSVVEREAAAGINRKDVKKSLKDRENQLRKEIEELDNRIGTGASSDIELVERRRGLQAELADGPASKDRVDAAMKAKTQEAIRAAMQKDPVLQTYQAFQGASPEKRQESFDALRKNVLEGQTGEIETGLITSITQMDTMAKSVKDLGDSTLFTGAQFEQVQAQINGAKIALGEFGFDDFIDGIRASLVYTQADQQNDIMNLGVSATKKFKTGVSDAFSAALDGSKKLKDSFGDLFKAIGDMITQKIIEMGVNKFIMAPFGLSGNPGMTANKGGPVGYAGGGKVTGGSGVRDDVPAVLSKGEWVIKRSSVNKYGESLFHQLNNGNVAHAASGGQIQNFIGKNVAKSDRDPQASLNSMLYAFGNASSGGADINLRNAFVYGSNTNPNTATSGYEMDKRLSRLALTDQDNKRNTIRDKKFTTLHDYVAERRAREEEYQKQLEAYKDGKKKAWRKTLVSAGIAMALGAVSQRQPGESAFVDWGTAGKRGKSTLSKLGGIPGKLYGSMKSGFKEIWPFNSGGAVGAGVPRDSIPALLTGGEMVMNRESVDKYGSAFFQKLNSGTLSGFAAGGYAGTTLPDDSGGSFSSSGEMTNNINISVNLDQSGNASDSVAVDTQSSNGSTLNEQAQIEVATMIKDAVVTTLVEQTRQGGILAK